MKILTSHGRGVVLGLVVWGLGSAWAQPAGMTYSETVWRAMELIGQGQPARGEALLTGACDGGDPLACHTLAESIDRGDFGEPDPERVERLFEKACTQGSAFSCGELGLRYAEGRGVPKRPERVSELTQQACEGGWVDSCGELGRLVSRGMVAGAEVVGGAVGMAGSPDARKPR